MEGIKPSQMVRQKRRDKRMDKILKERYKWGKRQKRQKGYNKLVQKGHARNNEGIRYMSGNTKGFAYDLEYLKRYLNRHVGKNWDKLYAELNRKFDKNSESGLIVFEHLFQMVKLDAVFEDGKPCLPQHERDEWSFYSDHRLYSVKNKPLFYIHPKTGQLMKALVVSANKLWAERNKRREQCQIHRREREAQRLEQERAEIAWFHAIERIHRLQEAHLARGGYYAER